MYLCAGKRGVGEGLEGSMSAPVCICVQEKEELVRDWKAVCQLLCVFVCRKKEKLVRDWKAVCQLLCVFVCRKKRSW